MAGEQDTIDRRRFLTQLGALLLTASTVGVSGCRGLFEWSAEKEKVVVREVKPLPRQDKTQAISRPDLAVVKGDDPAVNVRKAIQKMGGINQFVKEGNTVVIKPNLLTARAPEFAVTTNPIVVGALVTMCFEAGAKAVTVLDNPTSPPMQVYEISGIKKATVAAGGKIKVLTDRNFENTFIPQGRSLKQFPLVKDVFEADVFINAPIAKIHGLAGLTMAMKNLMGIMGQGRPSMHQDFHQKIVDLNTLVKPHLVVLDAYRILTDHGPSGGDLADVKLAKTIIVGTNQVNVDAYGTTLFGMEPTDLGYLVNATKQGLGEIELGKIKIDTD